MAEWTDTVVIQRRLAAEGWLSPDCYSREYAPLISSSAVYLLALFKAHDFTTCVVAYVGMSINLKQRMAKHQVLNLLKGPEWWVKRWFKPTHPENLRELERELIASFDPPWNIIGRSRGLAS